MTEAADTIRSYRRAFALPGGAHDRLIGILSRVLPAGIGLILAIMIFTPLSSRGEISFLLDRNKVAIARDRVKVENAMYRGVDSQGRAFSVSAQSALQESAQNPTVRMEQLSAKLALVDGPAEIAASDGLYDYDSETVKVLGAVTVTAPNGYRMQSNGVNIDMKSRQVVGAGGISGTVPAGTFSADRISADLGERTVTLQGNARLRMTPGQVRMP